MAQAKRAVNYGFRLDRQNLLPFRETEFRSRNTRPQSFGIPLESPGSVPEFLIGH
jgi:hypothetical protein